MISRAVLIALLPIVSIALGCSSDPATNPGGASGAGGSAGGAGGTGAGGASGSGGAAVGCFPYNGWNGMSPTVSLRNDLLANASERPASGGGVLRRACAFSSCHNDVSKEADLFIGPLLRDSMTQMEISITPADVTRMLGNVDGVMRPSKTLPSMQIVKPGDPANSFLMRKMDGCFTDIQSMCTALEPPLPGDGPCGAQMPQKADPLEADERDLIRRWIAQGAKNN